MPVEHRREGAGTQPSETSAFVFCDSQQAMKKLTHKIQDSLKDQLEEVVYFINELDNENEELRVTLSLS